MEEDRQILNDYLKKFALHLSRTLFNMGTLIFVGYFE